MLIKRVSFNDFLQEFEKHGRKDQFSYEAKKALYEYLNQISDDLGKPLKLDVIALCCEFTEYESLQEFNNDYSYSLGHDVDCIDDIYNYTTVIQIDKNSFIIQDF